MVFNCRCFSFLVEEHEQIQYETETETKTQTNSTATESFYTASSDFNRYVPNSHAKSSETLILANKRRNLRVFTVAELKTATKNFSVDSKIGEGAFGRVYKGVIKSLEHPFDEIQVAVKLSKDYLQADRWITEIAVLQVTKHPNIVKLIGYSEESPATWLLVYEYMVNGNLKDQLHSNSETHLSWTMRMKVAQHVACGLAYLHEEMEFSVILRGFNPSNILLDDQWNVKLAGFGSSRTRLREHYNHPWFVGTKAYAAPEHISEQHMCLCTPKSNVWSYGVFLYELITGRHPLDENRPQNEQKLLDWIKPYIGSNSFHEIIDPRLEGNYPLQSAQKLSTIANKCLSEKPKSRPKMSEVLKMLNKLIEDPSQFTNTNFS